MSHNWQHLGEADEAWSLQDSVALVITAPGSLYDPNRPEFDKRWEILVEAFIKELERYPSAKLRLENKHLSTSHYATAPWATGGAFPELTEVITLFKSINETVQDISGWVELAGFVKFAQDAWKSAQSKVGEGDSNGSSLPPLPSVAGIKAICISDMVQHFQVKEMPEISVDSRHFGRGTPDHPTWESRYCVLARVGKSLPQTFLYLLGGAGDIVEKMRIDVNDTIKVSFLSLHSSSQLSGE